MAKGKFKGKGNPLSQRLVNIRNERHNFLIVCEGRETEPSYFKHFKVSKCIKGFGKGGLKLIRYAIRVRDRDKKRFSQVWCVLDKDETPDDEFLQALAEAAKHNIHVAYSNESFELWFYLHFNYHDRYTHRSEYKKLLSSCLNFTYDKTVDLYDILLSLQDDAIKNAKHLFDSYRNHDPAHDNPCTTVHKLVKALLENSS